MSASESTKPVTPDRIMQYSFGYAVPLMLEAAINHRVFDVLDEKPRTLEEVQQATGASSRGLRLLMDALVGLEFLTRNDAGQYGLAQDTAKFLVQGKQEFRGGLLRHTSKHLLPHWMHLTEVVRTGVPDKAVNQEAQGAEFFEKFVEDLFPMNYDTAGKLAHAVIKDSTPTQVLDLAAGSGVWSIALAGKSPHVRVTAVDWPGVIPVTRRVADQYGVLDRFSFVEGDLASADFGTGYQVAILGHILHSEGVERSRALLKKTFAALAPGGIIAIAEWLVDEDRKGPTRALIFGVNMLVHTDQGDVFSFQEIRSWLEEMGFTQVRTLEGTDSSPLILADKPL